jgi:predicted GIY-YIG superfamily endonuclease
MGKCMICRGYVKNPDHDQCFKCFKKLQGKEKKIKTEDRFEDDLSLSKIFTTYIMGYGDKDYKIGYTNDLGSRMIEIKRRFPKNQLLYFREFIKESEARLFEAWLKKISDREIVMFIHRFQDKLSKVNIVSPGASSIKDIINKAARKWI